MGIWVCSSKLNTRGWLRSRVDGNLVVVEDFGETPQPVRAAGKPASTQHARVPGSGSFPGFGTVEHLGVLGCAWQHPLFQGGAMGACVSCSSYLLGSLGGCWWHSSPQCPHATSSCIPSGSVCDFCHIEQYSLGQHCSFLEFLGLVFIKLCILGHEAQHPLALEAFPQHHSFGYPQHHAAW